MAQPNVWVVTRFYSVVAVYTDKAAAYELADMRNKEEGDSAMYEVTTSPFICTSSSAPSTYMELGGDDE